MVKEQYPIGGDRDPRAHPMMLSSHGLVPLSGLRLGYGRRAPSELLNGDDSHVA